MNLQWSREQQEIRTRFETLGSAIAGARSGAEGLDQNGWAQLADQGFWRLPVPAEYGGTGGTWWEYVAALEGLSKTVGDLGFLLSIIAHAGCVRVLLKHGTEEQKRRLLPPLLSRAVGATAITEETGGSDVARIRTSAEPTPSGYELNGAKSHITNAPVADIIVVVGRIPSLGRQDITLFVVERSAGGVESGPAEQMLGNRTSPTADLLFRSVRLGSHAVLGQPGDGLATMYNMISLDRALYGVISAAFAEPVLVRCMKFTHARRAFKRRIADFQYVQQKLTDMKIAIETSRAISYAALDKLFRDEPDANLMCSLAKLVGTEGLFTVAQHDVQLHGHRGYMDGPHSQLLRDAAGTRIAGGTSDIQRVNIFNQLQRLAGLHKEIQDDA